MNWIQLNLCLIVLALLMPYIVSGEDNHPTSFHDEEEILPSNGPAESHGGPTMESKSSAQSDRRVIRQSYMTNSNKNVEGNNALQFTQGHVPAQTLDAQASSASKRMIYALNNKLSDFAKPAEETLQRFARNPEVMEDIVGQFQELGGGMTRNFLEQVSQSVPDISKSFGQALNEALGQTNKLAQAAPSNSDTSQVSQPLQQSNLSRSIDFGQLGQALSQNFLVGATQNLLESLAGQAQTAPATDAAAAGATASAGADTVAAPTPDADSERTPEQDGDAGSQSQKNPFEHIVGQSLLPGLPSFGKLPQLRPLSNLNPMSILQQLAQLMALGSEISEVRVLPEENSPFKVSPKQVDQQLLTEMKLKAMLKDALTKKTIPILWFHLANKNEEQKTNEELEMEAKLEDFEQQVIAELKQLQDLAKMANEVKKAQLQSGLQPTSSLTTKLNLFDIPIYDITLGDIERTLKDEHVTMLMQTLGQKKKDFQRQQQATTKYITDLTGAPNKRQTTPNEETLKSMGKDNMLKMMRYAYRMAAENGHAMPWVKEKMSNVNETDNSKTKMPSQQRQAMNYNMQMDGERKWLAEKEQRMGIEADRMWMNPEMQQPQFLRREMMPISDMQMQQNNERQMMPEPAMNNFNRPQQREMMAMTDMNMSPMQRQQQNNERQMMDDFLVNNLIMPPQRPVQRPQLFQGHMTTMPNMQMLMPLHQDISNEIPMMPEPMMNIFDMSQHMPIQHPHFLQRQMMPPMSDMQMPMQRQQQNNERQMMQENMMKNMDMPQQMPTQEKQIPQRQMAPQQQQQQNNERQMMQEPMMTKMDRPQQMPMQRQQQHQNDMMPMGRNEANWQQIEERMADTPTRQNKLPPEFKSEQTSDTKTDMKPKEMAGSESSIPNEMESKARFKDNFRGDMFGAKNSPSHPSMNYFYRPDGSHLPFKHGGCGGDCSNHLIPPPSHHHYHHHHSHNPRPYPCSYRAAIPDAEMLQHQQYNPKLMLKMRTASNEAPTPIPAETTNEKTPSEVLHQNYLKRLAKRENKSFSDNVAAYVVVLRNSDNRSSKSSRSRRKRSLEYATLEPIDESSLNELRKTYKNSLKEITLNPNETPAEVLKRYNAESIKEALQKANKQPLEIAAGEEAAEAKTTKEDGKVEQHQHVMQQQMSKPLPQTYTPSEDSQLVPATMSPEVLVENVPYITQPLSVSFNTYDTNALQEETYNNIISKYHSPGVYSTRNKFTAQNPYLHAHSLLESVTDMDKNTVIPQTYQLINHPTVDSTEKATKILAEQSPQFDFHNYLTASNGINKNLQYLPDYEVSSVNTHHPGGHILQQNTYKRQPRVQPMQSHQKDLTQDPRVQPMQSYLADLPQDPAFLDNIIAHVKKQLAECCNKCKNDILQSLDETLKSQYHANTFANKPHTLTYRKTGRDEDFEYKQWLAEMSNKGYSHSYLTKQHQLGYLKDGKLNLHVDGGPDVRYQIGNIFFKNNQSVKRESTLPETEMEVNKETEVVTAVTAGENYTEKPDEEDYNAEAAAEDDETGLVAEKQTAEEAADKNSAAQIETETELESIENKNNTIESKDTSNIEQLTFNTTKTAELSLETTTESMYILRGQFRPSKPNTIAFSVKQSKQFPNYKNINKLGDTSSIANDVESTDEKIEEAQDILFDIKHFSTTTSPPATSTPIPLTTSATNIEWNISNSTEFEEKTRSKKISRRKLKSRKSSPKPPENIN